MWEHDVAPDMGTRPQQIINDQIGDDYHVFIGTLCSRFGTQTSLYGSGTEEEFRRALDRRQRHGSLPRIMFYFRDPRASSSVPSARELIKIEDFKDQLKPLGVYHDYRELAEFEASVLEHISRSIDYIRTEQRSLPVSVDADAVQALIDEEVTADDEELGIFELKEELEDGFAKLSSISKELRDAQELLRIRTEQASAEIKEHGESAKAGNRDRRPAKRSIDRMSAAIDDYAASVNRIAPTMTTTFGDVVELLQRVIIISSEDGFNEQDEAVTLAEVMLQLRETFSVTRSQIASMSSAIQRTPRVATSVGRAKKNAGKSLEKLDEFFATAISQVDILHPQLLRYAATKGIRQS